MSCLRELELANQQHKKLQKSHTYIVFTRGGLQQAVVRWLHHRCTSGFRQKFAVLQAGIFIVKGTYASKLLKRKLLIISSRER